MYTKRFEDKQTDECDINASDKPEKKDEEESGNKNDDFASNIEDIENEKPKTKRFKTEEIKVDIDTILTEYSSSNTEKTYAESLTAKIENESSTYFVSKSEYSSPVLTKVCKSSTKV